jgi:glc operon protein GlcG
MKTFTFSLLAVAALFFLSSTVFSQQGPAQTYATQEGQLAGQTRPMTLAFAKQIVAAAHKAACTPPSSCTGAFALVDDTGVLIYEESIDGVQADAPELSIKKAKTSARWRRSTQTFLDAVKKGTNISYGDGTFDNMTLSPGGVPLSVNGKIVGGFGCGGVGSEENTLIIDKAAQEETAKIMGGK